MNWSSVRTGGRPDGASFRGHWRVRNVATGGSDGVALETPGPENADVQQARRERVSHRVVILRESRVRRTLAMEPPVLDGHRLASFRTPRFFEMVGPDRPNAEGPIATNVDSVAGSIFISSRFSTRNLQILRWITDVRGRSGGGLRLGVREDRRGCFAGCGVHGPDGVWTLLAKPV